MKIRNIRRAPKREVEKLMCMTDSVSFLICENLANPTTVTIRQMQDTTHPAILTISSTVL
jgi:hypothetical protein